jgi:hypothetical protein
MSCPSLSQSDVNDLLDKASSLFSEVQSMPCDETCQEQKLMEEIATNLDNAKDNYTTAESKYNAARKEYIIGHSGPSYYKKVESDQNRKNLEALVQENIDYFLVAMNATEKEINLLKTEIDNLNLMKKLVSNNTNVALMDVFGFDVSPTVLNSIEGFEPDLNTLNRQIYYESNKNERTSVLNRILYIIYYILFLVSVFMIYKHEMKLLNKILIECVFFFYPFLTFFFKILYNIFIIIIRFVT